MTVATTTNKAIATGNGVTTTFPFTFGTLPSADLVVTLFDLLGVADVQTEGADYTILGEGSEDGGAVVFTVPPPNLYTVLIQRIVPETQPTDIKNQGSFYPRTIERMFDRLVYIIQQISERVAASLTLPAQITGVSTQLPVPEVNTLFGWNADGTAITNFPLSTIATSIVYGDKQYQTFSGDGVAVNFGLISDPASLGNLDISIDGVVQVPVTDYSYTGTVLTFTAAPANGAVVLVRYDLAVPVGAALASSTQYTPPQTGIVSTAKDFLDSLWTAGTATGSSLIRFLQAGASAVARTVQDKLRETVSPEDFGAVGDGVTDDSAAFAAAVAQLNARGGGDLLCGKATYAFASTLTVTVNNVLIRGKGKSTSHDVGSNTPGTKFKWTGAAGGTIVEFAPVSGAGNQRGFGGGLIHVGLDGNGVADNGLMIRSWNGGEFNVFGISCLRTIVETNVVATLGEARDCQYNTLSVFGRNFAGSPNASTLIMDGDTVANSSFNRIKEINSTYQNGIGIQMKICDANLFDLVRFNSGGGSGKAVVFYGSNSGIAGCARYNRFTMLSAGAGGVTATGTTSFTSASFNNIIDWYDVSNGAPTPTIETGASLHYGTDRAVAFKYAHLALTLSDQFASAETQRALVTSESIRIINSSSNHARLTDGTNEWAVRMTGGDLEFLRISGTGQIRYGTFTGNADAPITGYITIKDNAGNTRKLATIA